MLTGPRSRIWAIGTMDDNDAKLAQQLAVQMIYKRINSKYVIHSGKPRKIMSKINDFVATLK